jgi:hypothetical protein
MTHGASCDPDSRAAAAAPRPVGARP